MDNKEPITTINSISELHRFYGFEKPKHPLVSVVNLTTINYAIFKPGAPFQMAFYVIACKRFKGDVGYGRSYYDFDEGSMMFLAPGQVVSSGPEVEMEEGWALFFHPDLIHASTLGRKITGYSFFRYDINEALHISEEEQLILHDCIRKIERECAQNLDKHTQNLIVSNIELLLNYCDRFFDRQFLTREKVNHDIVQRFEILLHEYFAAETLITTGLPDVKYFASKLNLSAKYLADVLHKFTGKSTQEHIHLQLTEKAKSLLWSTSKPVSQIAYILGFEHPSHFNKVFKTKTGLSPREYRSMN